MISLLFSNWRFFLDAILIIALVVLLFLINPFGIFGNGLQIGTTTNMVTEIQQIGELVTAEYYGEVISSLDESRLTLIEESEVQQTANNVYSEIKYALYDLYQYQQTPRKERKEEYLDENDRERGWRNVVLRDVSRRNIIEKLEFLNQPNTLRSDSLYHQVVEFLWREKYINPEKEDWNPDSKEEASVLLNQYNELKAQYKSDSSQVFLNYLDDGFEFAANFQNFFAEDQVSELSRTEQRKELAMVGRGWVKAGFDFSQFDESTFYLHEESGELHFFGLEPQILDADINPWFIPERAVPGFEIIDYQGALSFKDAQQVKQHCIQKLTFYAHQANIIEQAQAQGAETLKIFFSLITGQQIQKVHFHNDKLTQIVQEISEDEFINYYEGVLIDSLLQKEAKRAHELRTEVTNRTRNLKLADEVDSLRKRSLGRLRNLKFENSSVNFNYYSTLAYQIGQDSIVDQHEQTLLKQVRWDLTLPPKRNEKNLYAYKNPQYWYEDSLNLMMDFNAAINYLQEQTHWVVDTTFKEIENTDEAYIAWFDSSKTVLNYWEMGDTISVNFFDRNSIDSAFLFRLRHPFYYHQDSIRKYLSFDTQLKSITTDRPDTTINFYSTLTNFYAYDTLNSQLTTVNVSPFLLIDSLVLMQFNNFQLDTLNLFFPPSAAPTLPSRRISADQLNELKVYYRFMHSRYQQQQNMGPIVKASEWVRKKFAFQSNSLTLFEKIKKVFIK